jgi:hypothetical protein
MNPKRSLRRQLLKGAMAAPAVFTVKSASAQTNGSVAACIQRSAQQARVADAASLSNVDDNWVRMRLDVYTLASRQGTAVEGKFILGVDKARFWQIRDSTRGGTATASRYSVGEYVATSTGESKYALVLVDSSGNQVALAFQRPGVGFAINESCWASVAAAGASALRRT